MDTRSLGTRSFVTKRRLLILVAAMLLLAFVASEQALADSRGNHQRGDVARYILPPGNYGGIPFTQNSTDQLPLYSGLTPLRDNITNGGHRPPLPARELPADRRRHTRSRPADPGCV